METQQGLVVETTFQPTKRKIIRKITENFQNHNIMVPEGKFLCTRKFWHFQSLFGAFLS